MTYAAVEWRGRVWMAALGRWGGRPFRLFGGAITVVTPSMFALLQKRGRRLEISA